MANRIDSSALVAAGPAAAAGCIFVGYRRRDSQGFAGRLADDLIECFGDTTIFRDDDIPEGEDYTDVLREALAICKVFIVVIGPDWLTASDSEGRPRLQDPNDWVRREIEAALARGVWVMPVLVGGASMPAADDLPTAMAPMTRIQAVTLTDRHWEADLKRMIGLLTKRIPVLRNAPGLATRFGQSPVIGHVIREYLKRVSRSDVGKMHDHIHGTGHDHTHGPNHNHDHTHGTSQHRRRGIPRWLVTGVKRLLWLTLAFMIAWFLLENYASPELRKGVMDFFAFVADKARALIGT